jgi:hypothetical protein
MKHVHSISREVPAKAVSDLMLKEVRIGVLADFISLVDAALDFFEDLFNIAGENDE